MLYPLWPWICTLTIQPLADLLAWIAQNAGVSYLIHYLDGYLTIELPTLTVCYCNMDAFVSLCVEVGVPIATDKLEGPSTSLSFLRIFWTLTAWK